MRPPEPTPWQGIVYRHIPAESPFGPLDTHLAARSQENRWNLAGEPTIVFASDPETMRAELVRHVQHDRDDALLPLFRERRIVAVTLRLTRVFDLTNPAVTRALGITDAPACFADRAMARATAGFLRHVRMADGIVAPSLAFPNNPSHWNLVIFLERLTGSLEAAVNRVEDAGRFRADGNEPS